jgi:hypothetical protein
MKAKNVLGYAVIIACCLVATGCFSIEQEIFLNADGSGDVVIFISLPDLPEKMAGGEVTTKKSPADAFAEFRKELTTALPPTITLKQAKEVKQNGVQSLYAIFHFQKIEDIQRILANFGKDSLKDGDIGSAPQWSLLIEKRQNRSFYTQKFLLDVDTKAKAEIKAEVTVNGKKQEQKKTPEEEKASSEMDEQLKPLILSIVRLRFVLHTPSPIVDSNADIVLSSNTAVWNCSLAAFSKEKKAIELKASF